MKNYHWDAADYAQHSRVQQEWARVLMNKLQLQGDEYKRMITESGLQFLRVELIEKDMQHEGTAGFADWIRITWLPYTERIPKWKRENFIQEVVERYVHKHPVDMEGKVHVQMVRLEVEAVRKQSIIKKEI